MAVMKDTSGNSQTYHLVKSVLGLLVAGLAAILGVQDLYGRGWALLLIAGAIVVATVMRWMVFREKR
jgi:hypothetical protein